MLDDKNLEINEMQVQVEASAQENVAQVSNDMQSKLLFSVDVNFL